LSLAAFASDSIRCFSAFASSFDMESAAKTGPAQATAKAAAASVVLISNIVIFFSKQGFAVVGMTANLLKRRLGRFSVTTP
jgi:hypothetical protein